MRGSTGQLDKEANSMAYITKRGNSYSVRYTYEDEHGKSCDKWESFPTKEEATNRKKQIEHELAAGTFLIPSSVTVAEFLMDWLPKQQKRTLSGTTLHEVHQLLHNSFLLAVVLALHPRLKLLPGAFPDSNHFAECLFSHGGGLHF